jgi:hypothetical protein
VSESGTGTGDWAELRTEDWELPRELGSGSGFWILASGFWLPDKAVEPAP